MPRKCADDIRQVLGLLNSRESLGGFSVVPIDGKNEAETAAILRESMIFLSFSSQEGCPLPPMEAMACGCITIGYHGRGGAEYFDRRWSFPVDKDDVVGFAKEVERVISELKTDPQSFVQKTMLASDHILNTYTPECEEQDIGTTWLRILQLPAMAKWAFK